MAKLRAARDDPPGKLEHLGQELGEHMVTMVAWFRGEPAAANIVLTGNSHFYWRGAMHQELGPATSASYAIQRAAIEEACEAGAVRCYIGESGQSAGLAHFKEHFGAVDYRYPEIRAERLPLSRANQSARSVVKRLVGYRAG